MCYPVFTGRYNGVRQEGVSFSWLRHRGRHSRGRRLLSTLQIPQKEMQIQQQIVQGTCSAEKEKGEKIDKLIRSGILCCEFGKKFTELLNTYFSTARTGSWTSAPLALVQTELYIVRCFSAQMKWTVRRWVNRQSGMNFGALNSFLVPRDGVFHKGQGKSLVPPKIQARLCIFSACNYPKFKGKRSRSVKILKVPPFWKRILSVLWLAENQFSG